MWRSSIRSASTRLRRAQGSRSRWPQALCSFDQRPGKLSIAAAVGNFKAQNGLASDLGYAVNGQWRMNASFSAAPQNNDYGVAIGSSWTLN
jgi:YadA-like membrane anchor domain